MDRDSRSMGEVSVKSLEGTSTFLLKLQGHNILALRLPGEVAKEISSQDMAGSGILSKLKSRLGLGGVDQWRWFTVTSVDNPLLEQTNKFAALVTEELTKATGTTITKSDLAISATVPISSANAKDERRTDDGETHQMQTRMQSKKTVNS